MPLYNNYCEVYNNICNDFHFCRGYNLSVSYTFRVEPLSLSIILKEVAYYGNDNAMVWFQIRYGQALADQAGARRDRRHHDPVRYAAGRNMATGTYTCIEGRNRRRRPSYIRDRERQCT